MKTLSAARSQQFMALRMWPAFSSASPLRSFLSATFSHSTCQLSASPGFMRLAAWKHSLTAPPPSCVSPSARRNW